MWQLIGLSIIQSIMLSFGQFALKVALDRMPAFSWRMEFWSDLITNWWLMGSGILCGGATILWMYILKHWPLSMAYPMASMSYVFALIIAIVFLHEAVAWNRWVGIGLIMVGCIFVAK